MDKIDIQIFSILSAEKVHLLKNLLEVLSMEEKTKAEAFYFLKDRQQYILTRGMLRCFLARYLGIPPEEVQIRRKKEGKPFHIPVFGKQIFFNVSHTQDYCVFAFSFYGEIGIDIEHLRPITSLREIAFHFFSDEELAYIESFRLEEQNKAFFNCWTRREACLKAFGIGISKLETWKATSFLSNEVVHPTEKTLWRVEKVSICSDVCCALSYEKKQLECKIKGGKWEDFCFIGCR